MRLVCVTYRLKLTVGIFVYFGQTTTDSARVSAPFPHFLLWFSQLDRATSRGHPRALFNFVHSFVSKVVFVRLSLVNITVSLTLVPTPPDARLSPFNAVVQFITHYYSLSRLLSHAAAPPPRSSQHAFVSAQPSVLLLLGCDPNQAPDGASSRCASQSQPALAAAFSPLPISFSF
jgi:hypothetical protein